jgi:hypothetical protein
MTMDEQVLTERERIAILETAVAGLHSKINEFIVDARRIHDEILARIQALTAKPTSKFQLLGGLFGVGVFLAGLIWTASRYPEREEFEGLHRRLDEVFINQQVVMRDLADARDRIRELERSKP